MIWTYWITKNLGTAAFGEPELESMKDIEIVDVRDLIDGANNNTGIFKSKVEEVEEIILKGRKAVVACGSGISRSNAVALAYLVKNGMDFYEAFELLKKKVPVQNIDMGLLDTIKNIRWEKRKIYYPTVEDLVRMNREFVSADIEAVKKELEKIELTAEERAFLERLLAKKQGKFDMKTCIAIEAEGEVWLRRKDKNFDLDEDVLTD